MRMFQKILVGADGSSTALEAVDAAIDLARRLEAALHIVTAYKPDRVLLEEIPGEFHQAAMTHPADTLLEELGRRAERAGLESVVHAEPGDAAEAIVRVAVRVNADLVVVGNKGMHGVRRVLGSVPNTVAHEAPCSVLIVDTTG